MINLRGGDSSAGPKSELQDTTKAQGKKKVFQIPMNIEFKNKNFSRIFVHLFTLTIILEKFNMIGCYLVFSLTI